MKTPLTYDREQRAIYDADDHCVVDMAALESEGPVEHERAAFIVAACNSHEALVAVAEAICDVMSTPSNEEYWPKLAALTPKAKAALAQLKT